jgi:O-antigen ligase
MRAHGDFGQPNPFAGYLGLLLPLAVLLAASPGPRWRRRLAGGVAALLVAAMLMSLSRGAWLGAAGALAVVALHWSRRSRALLVPAALAVLTLIVLALLELLPRDVIERFATTLQYFGVFDARTVAVTPENFSVVERMAHWQAGWYMFLDHPLLGVGPGNYPARYDEYHLPGWLDPLGHAHNYYLNVAAELGVIGLATFLALLVAAFAAASRALRRAPEPGFERAVALGVLGGLLVFVLHNLFDSLFVHGVGIQVGIYLGLLGDARAATTGRPGSERTAAALARR